MAKSRTPVKRTALVDISKDMLWKAPSGNIVGVFISDRFFEWKDMALDYLDTYTDKGDKTSIEYLQSLDSFPIGSGRTILDRLNIRSDMYTPSKMGELINNASDWFGERDG